MKWKKKDGAVIDIKDMKDSHLLNSLRLCMERRVSLSKAVCSAYSMLGIFSGDMAVLCVENDITEMEKEEDSLLKAVSELRKEVDKRGLTPLSLRNKLTA